MKNQSVQNRLHLVLKGLNTLQIILRVDKQAASDELFEDEDDSDMEGEPVTGDGEDDSASDSGDKDGEDSDMDDDDDEKDDDADVATEAAAGGDSDMESDDGLDDEAMFRMDNKLAEYFKSLRAGKQVGSDALC